jgi:hypothetical protein
MNYSRFIAVGLFVLVLLFAFALPNPDVVPNLEKGNLDLPWNITVHEDRSTEVFRLRLDQSTLSDAVSRFHEPEDIAIYKGQETDSLEAYFGTVNIGPLKAKLITTLQAEPEDIAQMLSRAKGLSMSDSADKKIELAAEDRQFALNKTITGITFIPSYSGLTAEFFKERFGEPTAWLRLSENAVQYFYPAKGLSIVIDADGKEVLQYNHPDRFKLPENAAVEGVNTN